MSGRAQRNVVTTSKTIKTVKDSRRELDGLSPKNKIKDKTTHVRKDQNDGSPPANKDRI